MTRLWKLILLVVASVILGVDEGWHLFSDGLDSCYEDSSFGFEDDENFDVLVQSLHYEIQGSEVTYCAAFPVFSIDWLIEDEESDGVVLPVSLPLRAPPVVG